MTRPLYFMVAVWGEKYRSYLLDYCLPTLLLNISDIPVGSVLMIACPRDDWEHILRDKTTVLLSHALSFKWVEIASVSMAEANRASARAFASMTSIAYADKAVGIFLCPDYFLACDMVKFVNTSVNSGIEALVFPGLRISRERLDLELPTHLTLTMWDLPMVASMTLHPEARAYEWTSENDIYHTGHIWKRSFNGGMTVYCLTWSPLMLDYSVLPSHDPSSLQNEMLDGRYVRDNMTGLNVAPVLDRIPLLAFQDERDGPQIPLANNRLRGPLYHSFALLRTLRLPHIGELHRRLFLTPAKWLKSREEFIDPAAYLELRFLSGPWFINKALIVHDWWRWGFKPGYRAWKARLRIKTRAGVPDFVVWLKHRIIPNV